MEIKSIATFCTATALGTAAALSPMVELDPKAALLAGVISGIFALVQNNIKHSAPKDFSEKDKQLHQHFAIVFSIGIAALVAFAALKVTHGDVPFSKTLLVSFAGCVGKLAIDGIYHLSTSEK